MEFLDLDTDEDIAARVEFIDNLSKQSPLQNKEVLIAIGCWIAKGYLNSAQAQTVLYFADSYRVVPAAARSASLNLALWMTSYFHRNLPSAMCAMPGVELFMYRAQQATLIFTLHFSLEEQELVFAKLTEYKKFHD